MQAGEDHPQTWQRGLAAGLLGAFAAASLATAAPCHAAATPFLSSTGKHARQLAMHVPQHHPVCFADTDASWLGGRSTHACGATTVSAGAKGPLVEEEARLFRLRQEVEGEAREELNRKRMQLEDEARQALWSLECCHSGASWHVCAWLQHSCLYLCACSRTCIVRSSTRMAHLLHAAAARRADISKH